MDSEGQGTPQRRESGTFLRSFFRVTFWTGLGLVGLFVAVGFGASWQAGGSLPRFGVDALVQARALEAAGDLPRAFAAYQKAAILQAGVAYYSSSYAEALFRHRRLKEADAWFRVANRIEPTHAGVYASLGEIALEEERLDDAAHFFVQAVKLDPGSSIFQNELGVSHALLKRFPDAVADFEAAERLGGGAHTRQNLERARRDVARAAAGP
jgi:Flp pilus assembly protein TadD